MSKLPRKSPQQQVDALIDFYVGRDPVGELESTRTIDVNLENKELARFAQRSDDRTTWLYRGCKLRQVLK